MAAAIARARRLAPVLLMLSWSMIAPHAAAGRGVAPQVGYTQRIGATLPLRSAWRDASGRGLHFGDLLGQRPAILVLGYYGCSNLCSIVLQAVAHALVQAGLVAGRDVEVIAASIDPMETPPVARQRRQQVLGAGPEPGWHFLTGDDAAIGALTSAAGFRYAHTPDDAESPFAHAAGIVLVSPRGRVVRYFSGVAYAPDALRSAVADAAGDRPEPPQVLQWMRCFHYDPQTGRYTPVVMNLVRLGGGTTALALAAGWLVLRRRPRRPEKRA